MTFGLARRELRPRVPHRPGEGHRKAEKDRLTSLEGLAALSLDALARSRTGPRRSCWCW